MILLIPNLQEIKCIFKHETAESAKQANELLKKLSNSSSLQFFSTDNTNENINEIENFENNQNEFVKLMYHHKDSQGRIKVSERIRRAVLEPLEPIEPLQGSLMNSSSSSSSDKLIAGNSLLAS